MDKLQSTESIATAPLVSIIVPFKRIDRYAKECLEYCLQLDYQSFEIILLPDNEPNSTDVLSRDPSVIVRPTGNVIPPVKRNVGAAQARGEILAFIDSDAYPRRDWLKNAMRYLEDNEVVAVGGPSLTPASDDIKQKASGEILSSPVGGGRFSFRYQAKVLMECDEIPSCNLIVRRSAFLQLNGFHPAYYSGEDMEFCLRIRRVLKKKMLYAPNVIVYHHRRPLYRGHLKQISNYALHRGHFARVFPGTSRRPIYFAPSVLVMFLVGGLFASLLWREFSMVYIVLVGIYAITCIGAGVLAGVRIRSFRMFVMVASGIFLTHFLYGIQFLKGLGARRLLDVGGYGGHP